MILKRMRQNKPREKHQVLINKKGFDSFDTRHRTKQGEIRFVHVTVQSVIINSQRYLHCIYEDITERRKVEERNLAERELLQICNEASSSQELLHKLLSFLRPSPVVKLLGFDYKKMSISLILKHTVFLKNLSGWRTHCVQSTTTVN